MTKRLIEIKQQLSDEDFAEYLLSLGPIYFSQADNAWVVTHYNLAQECYKSTKLSSERGEYFIKRMPNVKLEWIDKFIQVASDMMVMNDGPRHTRMKRICYHGLVNSLIDDIVTQVEEKSAEIIRQLKTKPYTELLSSYIEHVSCYSLACLFEVPKDFQQTFYQSANAMTQFFGGLIDYNKESAQTVNQSASLLYNYFYELIKKRKTEPKQAFIDTMLQFQHQYQLSDDELISQCIMLLVAGIVTTSDQFSNNIHQLLREPTGLQELSLNSDDNLMLMLDELTRLSPAVSIVDRIVKEPMLIHNHQLNKGELVLIANISANRDSQYFVAANMVCEKNTDKKHLSFGLGPHYCIGAKLAKRVMLCMLTDLHLAFPMMRLNNNKSSSVKKGSLSFSGFASLHVELGVNHA